MNNTAIAELVEQTALLLEYREGPSFMVDELLKLTERVRLLEVPLELFTTLDLAREHDVHEFEGMLGYWFGGFSHEAVWNVREIILTGTNPLRDRFLRDTSPSVVGLLRVKSLPVDSIDFIRGRLGIRNVEQLKKACRSSVLSKSGEFSEQEELDILEDIVRLEELDATRMLASDEAPSGSESFAAFSDEAPDVADPDTMFLANADVLADAIVASLQTTVKTSFAKSVNDFASKETLETVRDQALGVVGKFRRFFMSRSNPRYQQILQEGDERARNIAERRATAEIASNFESAVNAPLEVVKVGAVRRMEAAVAQLDFLVKTDDPKIAFERIRKADFVKEVLGEDGRRLSVSLLPDFFTAPYNKRPTPPLTMNFYTASDFVWGTQETLLSSAHEHWKTLTNRAAAKGWTLSPFGLYNGVNRISSRTAERLYEKLDLPFVPAELRQGVAEKTWFDAGSPDLLSIEDMRADLHMHTTFSDGLNKIEEMIGTAQSLGLEYVALTDHTKNVAVANGMTDADFLRYWDVIDQINRNLRNSGSTFRLLKGAEVDILEDGGLDLTDEVLERADWIVASIHVARRQSREQLHRRYMDAFLSPYVDVIAHPTQRVIGVESSMDVDLDFLCENAKKYGKCLELNSQPRRLDLDVQGLALAKKYGVPIVISTDSHAAEQMAYLRFGVQQARCAGLTRGDVLNARSYDDFMRVREELKEKASRSN